MPHRLLSALLRCLYVLLLLSSTTLAADFTGRVVGVADGDTSTVLHGPCH